MFKQLLAIGALPITLLTGCAGLPEGIQPVGNFQIERYLVKWYEIARLDHSIERGLSDVSASYALRSDGGVSVLNRGYHTKSDVWKTAEVVAGFSGAPTQGSLKVSFILRRVPHCRSRPRLPLITGGQLDSRAPLDSRPGASSV